MLTSVHGELSPGKLPLTLTSTLTLTQGGICWGPSSEGQFYGGNFPDATNINRITTYLPPAAFMIFLIFWLPPTNSKKKLSLDCKNNSNEHEKVSLRMGSKNSYYH